MTYVGAEVHEQVIKAPKKWLLENADLTLKLSTKESSEFDRVYSAKLKKLQSELDAPVVSKSQKSLFDQLLEEEDDNDSCQEVEPEFLKETVLLPAAAEAQQ